MSSAKPREFFYFVESTFAETQSDWPSNGQPVYTIEPDVSSLTIDVRQSENIAPRQQFVHDPILGLRSGATCSWGHYLTASGVSAAETAQAVNFDLATIMHAGLGGKTLGWSIGLDGAGTTAAPGTDADPGFAAGDWGFFYDTSEASGEFHRIEASTATTVTLLTPQVLSFTPDAADVLHAVVHVFPDEDAFNHSDSNYKTLGLLIQGEDVDDVYELRGVKPTISLEPIQLGEELKIKIDGKVTTFPDAMPAKQTVAGTPTGRAPVVASIGTTTTVKIADFGSLLAGVDCRGGIEVDLGIEWNPVQGVCGTEGVKGYIAEVTTAKVKMTVALDDAWDALFFAGTKQHLLIQVGDQPTEAVGLYFARLKWAAKPVRTDDQGTASMTLEFDAMEDTASTSGLTGDDIPKRRAPFIFLLPA